MVAALGVTRPSPPVTIVINVGSVGPEMFNTDFVIADALLASSHSPLITFAAPVRKRGHSSTISRSRIKLCLDGATDPSTAVAKEEDVLEAIKAAECSHVSLEAIAAQEALL